MTDYTRREFPRLALLGLPAAKLLSAVRPLDAAVSKIAGVRIGLNVPYSFGNNAMNGDDVLKNVLLLGVTALELRSQPVELFLGAPTPAPRVTGDSAAR